MSAIQLLVVGAGLLMLAGCTEADRGRSPSGDPSERTAAQPSVSANSVEPTASPLPSTSPPTAAHHDVFVLSIRAAVASTDAFDLQLTGTGAGQTHFQLCDEALGAPAEGPPVCRNGGDYQRTFGFGVAGVGHWAMRRVSNPNSANPQITVIASGTFSMPSDSIGFTYR